METVKQNNLQSIMLEWYFSAQIICYAFNLFDPVSNKSGKKMLKTKCRVQQCFQLFDFSSLTKKYYFYSF